MAFIKSIQLNADKRNSIKIPTVVGFRITEADKQRVISLIMAKKIKSVHEYAHQAFKLKLEGGHRSAHDIIEGKLTNGDGGIEGLTASVSLLNDNFLKMSEAISSMAQAIKGLSQPADIDSRLKATETSVDGCITAINDQAQVQCNLVNTVNELHAQLKAARDEV